MHNFEVTKGFNDTTILFCRSCGLSYRLSTYRDRENQPGRAVWERMTFETPSAEVIAMAPCRIEQRSTAGQECEVGNEEI